MKDTKKRFEITEFEDTYGAKCSLQMSSSAMEDKIWFGVNDANPKIMVSKAKEHGLEPQGENGWMTYPIPSDVLLSTRMHLNREQVSELLPYLKRFVETGDLHGKSMELITIDGVTNKKYLLVYMLLHSRPYYKVIKSEHYEGGRIFAGYNKKKKAVKIANKLNITLVINQLALDYGF